MALWDHGGGFSVDTSVRIAAADRAGRERLAAADAAGAWPGRWKHDEGKCRNLLTLTLLE
jgi:hypothetical protein